MEETKTPKRNSNVKEEQSTSKTLDLQSHEPQHEPKPMTVEEYKRLKAKEKANYWCLGGDITDTRVAEGKVKKDKDGNEIKDASGAVLKWDDKFYITLSFVGGAEEFEVKEEQYKNIKLGESYYLEGRYQNKKIFSKDQLVKVITQYEELP